MSQECLKPTRTSFGKPLRRTPFGVTPTVALPSSGSGLGTCSPRLQQCESKECGERDIETFQISSLPGEKKNYIGPRIPTRKETKQPRKGNTPKRQPTNTKKGGTKSNSARATENPKTSHNKRSTYPQKQESLQKQNFKPVAHLGNPPPLASQSSVLRRLSLGTALTERPGEARSPWQWSKLQEWFDPSCSHGAARKNQAKQKQKAAKTIWCPPCAIKRHCRRRFSSVVHFFAAKQYEVTLNGGSKMWLTGPFSCSPAAQQ